MLSEEELRALERRFVNLWNIIGAEKSEENRIAKDQFAELANFYSLKERVRNNLNHLNESLKELDSIRHIVEDKNTIELALFYYNIASFPGTEDINASANWILSISNVFKIPEDISKKAHMLIFNSKPYLTSNSTNNLYVYDIDHAPWGKDFEVFKEDEINLWKESGKSKEDYLPRRKEQLADLIDVHNRPFNEERLIFKTPEFREKYDARAKLNFQKFIHLREEYF